MQHILLLACLAITINPYASASTLPPSSRVWDINGIGFEGAEKMKGDLLHNGGWKWWVEVGDKLLTLSDQVDPVFIIPHAHISDLEGLSNCTLLHNLGYAILNAPDSTILSHFSSAHLIPFPHENLVLSVQSANAREEQYSTSLEADAQATPISTLIGQVSQDRWFSDVKTLATYNRYTKGTDIAAAQSWIISQLKTLINITITTQPFTSGTTSGINVIGTIVGTTTPNTWVIIGGHYDSLSQSPSKSAPGAEDDGSGAAAVLEMARILNDNPPPSTVLLIFFSGEEQGLLGSAAHAQSLVQSGDASKVKLMHNMDMIAYQKNAKGPYQVILETTKAYISLFPYYRQSALSFTSLQLFESTEAWGSDHESYIKRGMPGLLTIDKDWDIYPSYHKTTDTPDKLNPGLGYEIIKLGLGAAAQVLGYPL